MLLGNWAEKLKKEDIMWTGTTGMWRKVDGETRNNCTWNDHWLLALAWSHSSRGHPSESVILQRYKYKNSFMDDLTTVLSWWEGQWPQSHCCTYFCSESYAEETGSSTVQLCHQVTKAKLRHLTATWEWTVIYLSFMSPCLFLAPSLSHNYCKLFTSFSRSSIILRSARYSCAHLMPQTSTL